MVVLDGICYFLAAQATPIGLLGLGRSQLRLAMGSLWEACRAGDLEGELAALGRGEDINSTGVGTHADIEVTSCLMEAVDSDHEELVALLLEQPALDVNLRIDGKNSFSRRL